MGFFQYLSIISYVRDTFNFKKGYHSKLKTDDIYWLALKKKSLGLALQKTFGKCLESFKKIAKGDGKTFAQKTRPYRGTYDENYIPIQCTYIFNTKY